MGARERTFFSLVPYRSRFCASISSANDFSRCVPFTT
jgi:hypothetical protein